MLPSVFSSNEFSEYTNFNFLGLLTILPDIFSPFSLTKKLLPTSFIDAISFTFIEFLSPVTSSAKLSIATSAWLSMPTFTRSPFCFLAYTPIIILPFLFTLKNTNSAPFLTGLSTLSIILEDVGCSILNETTLPSTFTPTILSSDSSSSDKSSSGIKEPSSNTSSKSSFKSA